MKVCSWTFGSDALLDTSMLVGEVLELTRLSGAVTAFLDRLPSLRLKHEQVNQRRVILLLLILKTGLEPTRQGSQRRTQVGLGACEVVSMVMEDALVLPKRV